MRRSGVVVIIRAAVIVAAVFAFYRYCVLTFECNRTIPLVLRRTKVALNESNGRAAALARDNIDRIRQVQQGCRTDVTPELLLAANFHVLGDYKNELIHATAALRIDHRPELYYDRAMAYLKMGNIKAAVDDLGIDARFTHSSLDDLRGELRDRVARAAGLR